MFNRSRSHLHFPRQHPGAWPPFTIDRRTIAKATAAFVAMTSATTLPRGRAGAQMESTLAGEWQQPSQVGGNGQLGFTADFPFHAIAPHWDGATDFPAAVELQVSADGETFSQPVVVGPALVDAGPPDRDGRIFGDLVFTEASQVVKYRGIDADGREAGIPGLSFTYIDATEGPGIADISTASPSPSLVRLPVIAREEWGANLAYGGVDRGDQEWTPEYRTVEHVVIHHSETPSFRDPLAEIRSIHYYHAVTRGWGDIGYNYLVDFMGNVYEGRKGGDNVVGGHAYQYAYGSSGICSMGSFKDSGATPECVAGLTWITAWCARDLDPLARADFHEQPNLPTICGHRDVNDSTCPGDGLYADLPVIRSAVADVISGAQEVLVDPEFSPGQIVETVVEGANVRLLPGMDGDVSTELPFASVLQVVDGPTTVDDEQWYELDGDEGSGWVASSVVSPSDALPPVGRYSAGDDVVINTDVMNIRTDAGLRATVVASMPFGTAATVLDGPLPATGYRWYDISSDYGEGWCVEQYLAFPGEERVDAQFATGDVVGVADPEGLRLRSAPGTGSQTIGSLSPGTVGLVVDGPKAGDGYTWMQIRFKDTTGWAAQDFLTLSDQQAPVGDPRLRVGDRVIVDTDSLNLRENAGIEAEVITSLGTGISAEVIQGPEVASSYNWFLIKTSAYQGWAVETFLTAANGDSNAPEIGATVYVDTDGINLRDRAGSGGEVLTVLYTNETASVLDGPVELDDETWWKIESDRGVGWAAAQYLGIGNPDPANTQAMGPGDQVTVATDGLNVRSAPGIDSEIVNIILTDEVALVVDGPKETSGYTWFKLSGDWGEGWAVDRYLRATLSASVAIGDTVRVIDGELNLRSGAGTDANILAILPDGARVSVIDGPVEDGDLTWIKVSSSRYGTGWSVVDYLE